MTTIVIVEKTGVLKNLTIKEYNEEELYKKCGFKKADDFGKQTEWNIKIDGKKYLVSLYGKIDGKANTENKYDFPPPVDNALYFGTCAVVRIDNKTGNITNLTEEMWTKVYEKLFGGFEDLAATALEDEAEVDELANVPKEKKTKQGYLKDGFVVDSSDTEEQTEDSDDAESSEEEEMDEDNSADLEEDLVIEDLGSELSEESYDYDSDSNK